MTDEFAYRVALAAEPAFMQWCTWYRNQVKLTDRDLFPWSRIKQLFETKYPGLEANEVYIIWRKYHE